MTVTVYPSPVYSKPHQNHARSLQILRPYQRSQWCGVFELPCRLVQYTPDVLVEACFQYLRWPYNTITKTMRGQTETEMVPATTCHTMLARVYREEEDYGLEMQEEKEELISVCLWRQLAAVLQVEICSGDWCLTRSESPASADGLTVRCTWHRIVHWAHACRRSRTVHRRGAP